MTTDSNLLPLLYDSSLTAGWHGGMVAVTRSLLHDLALPVAPRVLEVGCGGGEVLQMLAVAFPDARITGLDLNGLAVRVAAHHTDAAVGQANLLRLPFAPRSVDLLLALDSFDQAGVPLGAALAEAWRVLAPGGLLLVRVSAYPWLYGSHDRAFNTGRRYARHELFAALKAQGFALERSTHANALLAAPVVAMRLLERIQGAGAQTPADGAGGGALYASPLANQVVRLALSSEAALLRHLSLPFGLSLFALARKVSQ